MTEPHATGVILDPATILRVLDGPRVLSGIGAAAKLREHRLNLTTPGHWEVSEEIDGIHAGRLTVIRAAGPRTDGQPQYRIVTVDQTRRHDTQRAEANVLHLTAEGNPDHVRAAIEQWRNTAHRHTPYRDSTTCAGPRCTTCAGTWPDRTGQPWPCPDLIDLITEVRAYLTVG